MKRIAALFLIVIFSFQTAALAKEIQPSQMPDYSAAIEKLLALEIMEGYLENEKGEFLPQNEITKVEFYVAIVKAMSSNTTLNENIQDTPFRDLTASHWAAGYINEAISLNILKDYGEYFYPEDSISYNEALKITLDAMGYGEYAKRKGGFPSGYIRVAKEIELSKGVKAEFTAALKRGEAAQLISNAVDISIADITGYDGSGAVYSVLEGTTIINRQRGIYKGKGRVNASEFTSLNGNKVTGKGYVEIDNKVYAAGNTDISDKLGFYVEFYYYDDKKSGETEVLYYVVDDKNNDVTIINASDISNATSSLITYSAGNKTETKYIESNANVIYNGKYDCKAVNLQKEKLKPAVGSVLLIDTNDDSRADIVIIHDVQTYVVETAVAHKLLITDQNGLAPLNFDDNKIDYMIIKDSKPAKISDLKKWDIINVEKSLDSAFYYLNVSSRVISGAAESYGDNKVTISGTEYPLNKNIFRDGYGNIYIGEEGKFYLDNYGNIAASDYAEAKEGSYGYIVKCTPEEGIRKKKTYFRIFDSDIEFKNYESAERIMIDGYPFDKADEVIERLSQSGVSIEEELEGGYCQLVKFILDENGKIKSIDTVLPNKNPRDTDLECFAPKASRSKGGTFNTFGTSNPEIRRFTIDANTIVFDIPSNKTKEDEFDIKTSGYFKLDQQYDVAGYDAKNLGIAKACIINSGGAENTGNFVEHDAIFGIVARRKRGTDPKGNDAEFLYIVSGGKEKLYYVTNKSRPVLVRDPEATLKPDEIRAGDIVSVTANDKGEVKFIYKLFPEDNTTSVIDIDNYLYGYGSYKEYIFGHVVEKNGSGIVVECNGSKIYCYLNSYASYGKYIMDEKKAVSATSADIIASSDGRSGSKVFVRVRNGDVKEVFIYE